MSLPMPIDQTPAWRALAAHASATRTRHLRDLFAADDQRFDKFSFRCGNLLLDLSRQRIDGETFGLLLDLARAAEVEAWRDRMLAGEPINTTENRAALHTALRLPASASLHVDGIDIVAQVHGELQRMGEIIDAIRNGTWRGTTEKQFRSVVAMGIGGSDLGPRMAMEALAADKLPDIDIHFVSNVDGTDIARVLQKCDAETTLFVVASKTFTTQETMANAETARALAAGKTRPRHYRLAAAFHGPVGQYDRAGQVRHPARAGAAILGLGRWPLFAVVGDRFPGRARHRHGEVPRNAGWRPCHGPPFPHGATERKPACAAGAGRRLECEFREFAGFGRAALRSGPVEARPLSAAGRYGEQRQGRRPLGPAARFQHRAHRIRRARHQRPACLLSAAASGPAGDRLRFHRAAEKPLSPLAGITTCCWPMSLPRPRR
jgi:hypothetical protein